MEHTELTCPGCRELVEWRIICDVYGCNTGRNCTEATPEQRAAFEQQIAERIAALPATSLERA